MQNKACFSELPNSQELATHQLGLITKPAVARAGSLAQVQLKIYWHGGVGVVEMQNKAKAQPAWLQLAAWAQLSLAIANITQNLLTPSICPLQSAILIYLLRTVKCSLHIYTCFTSSVDLHYSTWNLHQAVQSLNRNFCSQGKRNVTQFLLE